MYLFAWTLVAQYRDQCSPIYLDTCSSV